jgi:hypothetical protein
LSFSVDFLWVAFLEDFDVVEPRRLEVPHAGFLVSAVGEARFSAAAVESYGKIGCDTGWISSNLKVFVSGTAEAPAPK